MAATTSVPAGYAAKPSADGTGLELIPPKWPVSPAWIPVVACLGFAFGLFQILRCSLFPAGREGCPLSVLFFFGPLMLLAIVFSGYIGLKSVVEYRWLVRPGSVTRRMVVPLLGIARDRVYSGVVRFEIWHNTRWSKLDFLYFYTLSGRRPILVDVWPYSGADDQNVLPTDQPNEAQVSGLEAEVDSTARSVARFLAEHAGVPLEILEVKMLFGRVSVVKTQRTGLPQKEDGGTNATPPPQVHTYQISSRGTAIVSGLLPGVVGGIFVVLPVLDWVSTRELNELTALLSLLAGLLALQFPYRYLIGEPYEAQLMEDGRVLFKRVLSSNVRINVQDITAIRWEPRWFHLEGTSDYQAIRVEHTRGHVRLADVGNSNKLVAMLRRRNPSISS